MSRIKGQISHKWSDNELELIIRKYSLTKTIDLALELNLPYKTVLAKACYLGLKKDRDFLAEHQSESHLKRWEKIKGECI